MFSTKNKPFWFCFTSHDASSAKRSYKTSYKQENIYRPLHRTESAWGPLTVSNTDHTAELLEASRLFRLLKYCKIRSDSNIQAKTESKSELNWPESFRLTRLLSSKTCIPLNALKRSRTLPLCCFQIFTTETRKATSRGR